MADRVVLVGREDDAWLWRHEHPQQVVILVTQDEDMYRTQGIELTEDDVVYLPGWGEAFRRPEVVDAYIRSRIRPKPAHSGVTSRSPSLDGPVAAPDGPTPGNTPQDPSWNHDGYRNLTTEDLETFRRRFERQQPTEPPQTVTFHTTHPTCCTTTNNIPCPNPAVYHLETPQFETDICHPCLPHITHQIVTQLHQPLTITPTT